ncbi:site-specific integrase, partial [bacterium]
TETDKSEHLPDGDIFSLDRILEYVASQPDSAINRRDRAALGILRMGRRSGEALAVTRDDVVFKDGVPYLRVTKQVQGADTEANTKKNKRSELPIPTELVPFVLATYEGVEVKSRTQVEGKRGGKVWQSSTETILPRFLIPSLNPRERRKGQEHMTYWWLYHRVVGLGGKAGVPCTPHMLRAVFGTNMDEDPSLTDKERGTAMAQTQFLRKPYSVARRKKVDAAVLNIKLGGRKDEAEGSDRLAAAAAQLGIDVDLARQLAAMIDA